MSFTIGSLFDGSGGFPLAAFMCGGVPVWASEIEPYPIAVTTSRFPFVKHLGDISKINGAEIEPVDVITFGSPCQDLSVAGKRAGLKHEANGDEETTRSGLFMEAVRIIKEMREATNGVYPRVALWENVPGAFSSNKGEDFRIVCEELIKVVEPRASMPPVPKNGWAYADSYVGDGWSLAYRVFDAQYWGVPQRRRRIHLVADFRGECAREILFEREGLRGYFAEGRTPWKSTSSDAERSSGTDDSEGAVTLEPGIAAREGGHVYEGVSGTLRANAGDNQMAVAYSFDSLASNSMKSKNPHSGCRQVEVAKTLDTTDPNPSKNQGGIAIVEPVPYTLKIRCGCEGGGKGALIQTDKSATLATNNDQYLFQPIAVATQQGGAEISENGVCPTITAAAGMSGNNQPWICHPDKLGLIDSIGGQAERGWEGEIAPCLKASHYKFPPVICKPVTYDARGNGDGNTASTITGDHENRITDYTSVVVEPMLASGKNVAGCLMASGYEKLGAQEMFSGDYTVIEQKPVYCLQGNGIDRADTAGCNGKGWKEDVGYTLNTIDRPAVAYAMQGFGDYKDCGVASGLKARDYKDATDLAVEAHPVVLDRAFYNQGQNALYEPQCYADGTVPTLVARGPAAVAHGVDCRNFTEYPDLNGTLQAKPNGGFNFNSNQVVRVRYIVRRLTPTECARLQGFADRWGDIDPKEDFTEEEYRFWQEVRNTHAAINGKTVKEYTKQQMLTWYNKLHTDSAEYKLWGNGIALPPALYCMQGIAEAIGK